MKQLYPFYSIGHFINEPQKKTEFEIIRFEEIQEEPNVEDFHRHTFYEIIWVESGRNNQTIDYQKYCIGEGSLFFISPGQFHHFEEWHGLKGGSVFFTENFFLLNHQNKDKLFELSFLDNLYANPSIQPDPETFQEILQTIQQMDKEQKRPDRSESILQALLQVLLERVQRAVDHENSSPISKKNTILFKKFKELLDKHYLENLKTGTYASMLNITQHHLNHVIRQITGKTATEVIRARSILEAKRLLSFTDMSISEVASELNYYDSSYFTKLFRADTGMTPADFKKLSPNSTK